MRRRLLGLSVVTLFLAGCASGPFARQANNVPIAKPTAAQLVAHLNQNAQGVQSLESTKVWIDVKQGSQPVGLDAMLAYQKSSQPDKPSNFRLMAETIGGTEADFGSNEQEFWFWIKRAETPALYHCSYDDFARARNFRMPIHPDWIAEALSLKELGPAEQYQLREVNGAVELVSQITSPQGQTLQKVAVISLKGKDNGRIVRHHLRTAQGKELWSAEVLEYQTVRNVVIPRRVRLRCPEEKLEMSLKLDECKLNTLVPGRYNQELFARPNMRGVQTIDLARGPNATPSSIQKVRGSSGE